MQFGEDLSTGQVLAAAKHARLYEQTHHVHREGEILPLWSQTQQHVFVHAGYTSTGVNPSMRTHPLFLGA